MAQLLHSRSREGAGEVPVPELPSLAHVPRLVAEHDGPRLGLVDVAHLHRPPEGVRLIIGFGTLVVM